MRSISILLMVLASAAAAGFLPLIHDRPKRDNPFDPAVSPRQLPIVGFPTFTATPTPGPACGGLDGASAFATFESTADGFVADTCCPNFVAHSPALSATTFCKGAQSLCSSVTVNTASSFQQLVFKREYGTFQDWSGRVLAVWAYFNPGWEQASAQVYIKSTGGFVYSNGPITHPPAGGGWVRVLFDLGGAPNYIAGATNTAQVREVGMQLYINLGEGAVGGGLEICIDEFSAESGTPPTPTPTFSPTPTPASGSPTWTPTVTPQISPTPTATPAPCSADYDFEAGAQGWAHDTTYDLAITASAVSSAQAHCGAQSLGLTVDFSAGASGAVQRDMGTPQDLRCKTVTAWLYVPAGMSADHGAKLFAQAGAGWGQWIDGTYANLPVTAGWIQLSLDIASGDQEDQVQRIGLQIQRNTGPVVGGTFYLDEVALSDDASCTP